MSDEPSPAVPDLETARLHLRRLAIEDAPALRIEAEIEPDNVRSVRLAGKLGFRREALLRDRLFVADRPRSICMYALLRTEWKRVWR